MASCLPVVEGKDGQVTMIGRDCTAFPRCQQPNAAPVSRPGVGGSEPRSRDGAPGEAWSMNPPLPGTMIPCRPAPAGRRSAAHRAGISFVSLLVAIAAAIDFHGGAP